MPDYLSVEDVLLLHADQIELYGGDQGVRDIDLLDSAVAQPQAAFGGQMLHEYPFEMAAAYLFRLMRVVLPKSGSMPTPGTRFTRSGRTIMGRTACRLSSANRLPASTDSRSRRYS